MFETNNIATLTDIKGKNDIQVEVNKNNEIKDFVEFKVKDENGIWIKSYIKINDLYYFIFPLLDTERQEKLMPIRQTQIRTYIRQHKILLKRNMKKGEMVVANCRIDVPLIVEEGLRGLLARRKSRGILLTP